MQINAEIIRTGTIKSETRLPWRQLVAQEIERRELTLDALEEKTQLSKQALQAIAKGDKAIRSVETLGKILTALDMRVVVISRGGTVTEVAVDEKL